MATITKEITEKLKADIESKIEPVLESLRKSGNTDRELQDIVIAHYRAKIRNEYQKTRELKPFNDVFQRVILNITESDPDSKAEWMLHELLQKNKIPSQFHYKIGPYIADFLIDKVLVVELDGAQHENQKEHDSKRDKYMEKLGYHVLRIPLRYFILDGDAVIEAIKEARKRISF